MALGFNDGVTNRVPDRLFSTKVDTDKIDYKVNNFSQRGTQGDINHEKETWSIAFTNRAKADIDDIISFLSSKKGHISFPLVIPNGSISPPEETVNVVCESFIQSYVDFDIYSCSATFKRVYP